MTGDKGTTSLVGGQRTTKNDPRLEAYGTVDELNAHIGLLRQTGNRPEDDALLLFIQNKLFVIGSYLATDTSFTQLREASRLCPEDIARIEDRIDTLDATIPPLHAFLLPGGTAAAAKASLPIPFPTKMPSVTTNSAEKIIPSTVGSNSLRNNVLMSVFLKSILSLIFSILILFISLICENQSFPLLRLSPMLTNP